MAHIHKDSETYYLDQLCLIGLSGVFGAVCLALYFWKSNMLTLMLGSQFHPWVLGSGFLLVAMALVRAVILWQSVGTRSEHAHDHEHDCCGHDPDHGHEHHQPEGACPEPGHDHAHHHHDHDHGHDAHDHPVVPIRYMLLLLPIILFLIGFPNKGPQAQAATVTVDMSQVSTGYAGLIGSGVDPWQQVVMAAALTNEGAAGPAIPLDFKTLEQVSLDKEDREEWSGKLVKLKGQFLPSQANDRVFSLVRFRIRCCAADAIQLNVPMVCKESLPGIKPQEWVEVTGRIHFQRRGESYATILQIPNRQAIVLTDPDANPWVAN